MIISASIVVLGVGQFLYGISNALSSEQWTCGFCWIWVTNKKKWFFSIKGRTVTFLGRIIAGGGDAFVCRLLKQNLYFVNLVLLVISLVLISVFIRGSKMKKNSLFLLNVCYNLNCGESAEGLQSNKNNKFWRGLKKFRNLSLSLCCNDWPFLLSMRSTLEYLDEPKDIGSGSSQTKDEANDTTTDWLIVKKHCSMK